MTKQNKPVLRHEPPVGLNISKSVFPAKEMAYNDWCRAMRVGSRFEKDSMYKGNDIDFTKFKKK
jgi:hypothetical protein